MTTLVVGRDHYAARPEKFWISCVSATVTVVDSAAKSLETLVEEVVKQDVTDEVVVAGDGTTLEFSGTIAILDEVNDEVIEKITPSSITFTATIGAAGVDITDDGEGALAGTGVTGTIDYDTGDYTLVFTTAPDDETDVVVDYTTSWLYPSNVSGVWLTVADDINATFSGLQDPTATSGITLTTTTPLFLLAQPHLVSNAKFISPSGDIIMSVELLV